MDKNRDPIIHRLLRWRYPSSRVGQVLSCREETCRWHVLGRKKPRPFGRGFVLALPIFPGSHPPSIVGANELNFCVRDGNRWTLTAINTNSCGWLQTIFYIKSVTACDSIRIVAHFYVLVNTLFRILVTRGRIELPLPA